MQRKQGSMAAKLAGVLALIVLLVLIVAFARSCHTTGDPPGEGEETSRYEVPAHRPAAA